MREFGDLYHAINLIHEKEKDIEKLKETIKKRENEIAKLKEKSREKFLDTHTENYKILKNRDFPDYPDKGRISAISHFIKEPILFIIIDISFSVNNNTCFTSYVISNKFSIGTETINDDSSQRKFIPTLYKKGNKVLSDRTIDILINMLSTLSGELNSQIVCIYQERFKVNVPALLDKCLAIVKMLE